MDAIDIIILAWWALLAVAITALIYAVVYFTREGISRRRYFGPDEHEDTDGRNG